MPKKKTPSKGKAKTEMIPINRINLGKSPDVRVLDQCEETTGESRAVPVHTKKNTKCL